MLHVSVVLSCLLLNSVLLFGYTTIILFIYLLKDNLLSPHPPPPRPPPVWAIEITAAMNVQVFVFVWTYALLSLGSITRSGLFRSYGVILYVSHFLRICLLLFKVSIAEVWVPIALYSGHPLRWSRFKILAILTGILWHVIVFLICNFLMICDAEQIYMSLFCHQCIFLGEIIFQTFCLYFEN